MSKAIIEAKNQVDDAIRAINDKLDEIVSQSPITLSDGQVIASWKGLLAENDKLEIAIKEMIKSGEDISETKHFVLKVTKTQEYNPEKLREAVGDVAEIYIEKKESVKKSDLDKAVKAGAVDIKAHDALVLKSVSVSFKPKEDVKDLSVIEM